MPLRIRGSLDEADLLFLPWSTPLEQWPKEHIVALPRGISRHVVRFIQIGDSVFAIKEINDELAVHEYRQLKRLRKAGIPCVKGVGVVQGRHDADGEALDSMLITKHLAYSLPYRAVFSSHPRHDSVNRLLDALVVLLVRLHLVNFAWKDCSLSNTLFRRDAGDFAAYLVDAETGEMHESLSAGMRWYDVDTATSNIAGELMDLQAGGKLPVDFDPVETALTLPDRYAGLWALLTQPIELQVGDRGPLVERIGQLNDLGFDVGELDVSETAEGQRVRVRPRVVDAGHHTNRLMRLTGLDVGENQARRLLNDLDAYVATRIGSRPSKRDEQVCAHRWLTEVYEVVVGSIPEDLTGKLEPAEVFHEVLEHRWLVSKDMGHDIGLEAAVASYIENHLTAKPVEQAVLGSKTGRDSDETQEIRLTLRDQDRD